MLLLRVMIVGLICLFANMVKYEFENMKIKFANIKMVGNVVQWLACHAYDQHGLSSKSTCTILLCPWERHFTALSSAW